MEAKGQRICSRLRAGKAALLREEPPCDAGVPSPCKKQLQPPRGGAGREDTEAQTWAQMRTHGHRCGHMGTDADTWTRRHRLFVPSHPPKSLLLIKQSNAHFRGKLSFETAERSKGYAKEITGMGCFSTDNFLPTYFQTQKSLEIKWKGLPSVQQEVQTASSSNSRVKPRSIFLL